MKKYIVYSIWSICFIFGLFFQIQSASADSCGSIAQITIPGSIVNEEDGNSESPSSYPITGGTSSGTKPNLIPNNSDIVNASKTKVTTLHINESAFCKMQTKNIGNEDAGGFQSRCYISDGYKIDNNPRDEGKEDTQGLDKDSTHNEYEDFVAPEYPGTYNAVWCTDSAKQISELNEGDNCHAEDVFTVWSSPNIVSTSISTVGGRTIFQPGEAVSIDASFANWGENFGKTILIGYYLDGILIDTDHIKRENLRGGMEKTENLGQLVLPLVPGNHAIRACSDIDNRITETNESDNCKSLMFEIRPLPNFTANSISAPTSMMTGDVFNPSVAFSNQGGIASQIIKVGYYLDGALVGMDQVQPENIPMGASRTETLEGFSISSAGTHVVKACVDYASEIGESNEGDNCAEQTVTVIARILDLSVSNLNTYGAVFRPGSWVSVSADFVNGSNIAIPSDTTVSYYMDGTLVKENVIAKDFWLSDNSKRNDASIRAPVSIGQHTVKACIDGRNILNETDEVNNCKEVVITVQAITNLTESSSKSGQEIAAYPGMAMSIPLMISNSGDLDILNDIGVTPQFSGGPEAVAPQTIVIPSSNILKKGYGFNDAIQVTAPNALGNYTLKVCADSGNVVSESNENDNCVTLTVVVISQADAHSITMESVSFQGYDVSRDTVLYNLDETHKTSAIISDGGPTTVDASVRYDISVMLDASYGIPIVSANCTIGKANANWRCYPEAEANFQNVVSSLVSGNTYTLKACAYLMPGQYEVDTSDNCKESRFVYAGKATVDSTFLKQTTAGGEFFEQSGDIIPEKYCVELKYREHDQDNPDLSGGYLCTAYDHDLHIVRSLDNVNGCVDLSQDSNNPAYLCAGSDKEALRLSDFDDGGKTCLNLSSPFGNNPNVCYRNDVMTFGVAQSWIDNVRKWTDTFGKNSAWAHVPKFLADVNGDGRKDIVVAGDDGIDVAFSSGSAFDMPQTVLADAEMKTRYIAFVVGRFSSDAILDMAAVDAHGCVYVADDMALPWKSMNHCESLGLSLVADDIGAADLNGRGYNSIVILGGGTLYGFSFGGVSFRYYQISSDAAVMPETLRFSDANGYGMKSISWFENEGDMSMYDASSMYSPFFYSIPQALPLLSLSDSDRERLSDNAYDFADVDMNGYDDTLLFANDGIMFFPGMGSSFNEPQSLTYSFGVRSGWDSNQYPLLLGDVNGNGISDIVGFGEDGVYVFEQ